MGGYPNARDLINRRGPKLLRTPQAGNVSRRELESVMNMKALLCSTAIGALSIAPALAADISRPMPPAPPPMAPAPPPYIAPFSWTGFYVGASIGAVWGSSSVRDASAFELYPTAGSTHTANRVGFLGGLQGGFNWQVSSFVLGIEADYSWASANKTTNILADAYFNSSLSGLGTIRGRLGFAADRFMIYATGGGAYTQLKERVYDATPAFSLSATSNPWGWVVGGGVEYALIQNWSVKVEYLHVFLPNSSPTITISSSPYTFAFKRSLDIVRVGANYRF
jgi:outer membrane immunogenic protein